MYNDTTIQSVAAQIARNYDAADIPMYGKTLCLPDHQTVIEILDLTQKLLFPAYFGDQQLVRLPPEQYSALLLDAIYDRLSSQIARALGICTEGGCQADYLAMEMIQRIPYIQEMLHKDLLANFDGDPAAASREEVVFSYPGFYAIFVYRIAHELYQMQVPMIPRIMTEHAHSRTGIDINPGATIGEYFFIDHGTGVVVGETTVIGNRVKMYQGATLGALSPRAGHDSVTGQRHPTVGDNVTIYAGATILGGETVIGANTVIGGNTFITDSVKDATRVTIKAPELKFRQAHKEGETK